MEGQSKNILELVRQAATKRILFLPHAVRQMSRLDRMISVGEIKQVVRNGEVIEDYPEDVRGHSYLILGQGQGGRTIHVVCAPREDYLAIITAYIPDPDQWEVNFRKRKK
ncbi:MAG TPA: DUF4258 domain-containing protein [Thermodesulfobacteriota bacterium]|nr:DUF4258 domain-containing protein [Thermodesulfobacteriota bacterium]